jgi:hypothetical protein
MLGWASRGLVTVSSFEVEFADADTSLLDARRGS